MNIIFDLDGTLIDSAPDIQAVANRVLQSEGVKDLSLIETREFIGEGAAVFVKRMLEARDIPFSEPGFEALHNAFLSHYSDAVDRSVFYPHVEDTLALLKRHGHKLGLCTNKPESAARSVCAHMKLDDYLDAFVAGGMAPTRKPAPEMLRLAQAQLGDGTTLYVGDSEIDATTAERAGIPFALFTEGYRKKPVDALPCQWVFDDFRRLPEIVEYAQQRLN